MVLNSQSPRADSPGKGKHSGAYTRTRRRRSRGHLLFWLLAVVIIAAVLYYFPRLNRNATGEARPVDLALREQPETPVSAPAVSNNPRPLYPPTPKPAPAPAPTVEQAAPQPSRPAAQPTEQPKAAAGDPEIEKALGSAEQLVAQGKLVQAREQLNRALLARKPGPADAARLRASLAAVNQTLVFSPKVFADDPLMAVHVVEEGDRLTSIAPRFNVPWKLISRINGVDPSRMRIGAKLKAPRGPLHAVVDKSDYRMDIYLGDPSKPGSTYIRSFDVGLGSGDSTPIGRFAVKRGKIEDPDWKNPRTGEYFASNDPKNPIGERWIGLRGIDASTESLQSYGIHGTIEPGSIGRQASMGCVRLLDEDISLVYDLLTEEQTTVTIQP